jgi:hypothetical protein
MPLVKLDGAAVLERLGRCLPYLGRLLEPQTPLAELRLDSLDRVELLCVIGEEFGVRLSEADLLAASSVGDLAGRIALHGEEELRP